MAKASTVLWLSLLFGAGIAGAAPVLTADPLTKLPLIPATAGMLGNQPQSLDPATVCQSKMAANTYSVVNSSFAATNTWYAAHLGSLKHIHAAAGKRGPKDGYYSAN